MITEKLKVLFLDIDGVLNRFKYDEDGKPDNTLDEGCITRLDHIVRRTNCKIVISSTWKISSHLMDILEEDLFPKLPKGCVIGCTKTHIPQVKREVEIQEWLDIHKDDIDNYVILDDYDFELKSFINDGHCVITDALDGLTIKDMNECIRILNTERKDNGQT